MTGLSTIFNNILGRSKLPGCTISDRGVHSDWSHIAPPVMIQSYHERPIMNRWLFCPEIVGRSRLQQETPGAPSRPAAVQGSPSVQEFALLRPTCLRCVHGCRQTSRPAGQKRSGIGSSASALLGSLTHMEQSNRNDRSPEKFRVDPDPIAASRDGRGPVRRLAAYFGQCPAIFRATRVDGNRTLQSRETGGH